MEDQVEFWLGRGAVGVSVKTVLSRRWPLYRKQLGQQQWAEIRNKSAPPSTTGNIYVYLNSSGEGDIH